jgi:hypothetical protein
MDVSTSIRDFFSLNYFIHRYRPEVLHIGKHLYVPKPHSGLQVRLTWDRVHNPGSYIPGYYAVVLCRRTVVEPGSAMAGIARDQAERPDRDSVANQQQRSCLASDIR